MTKSHKWNTKYQPNQGRGKQNSVRSLCSVWYFNYFYIKDCNGGLIIWWGQNDATMLHVIASTFGLMFTPNLTEILCKEKHSCIFSFEKTILIFAVNAVLFVIILAVRVIFPYTKMYYKHNFDLKQFIRQNLCIQFSDCLA